MRFISEYKSYRANVGVWPGYDAAVGGKGAQGIPYHAIVGTGPSSELIL